jgi:hypothetical protein
MDVQVSRIVNHLQALNLLSIQSLLKVFFPLSKWWRDRWLFKFVCRCHNLSQEYILIRVRHFDFSSYGLCEDDFRVFSNLGAKNCPKWKFPEKSRISSCWHGFHPKASGFRLFFQILSFFSFSFVKRRRKLFADCICFSVIVEIHVYERMSFQKSMELKTWKKNLSAFKKVNEKKIESEKIIEILMLSDENRAKMYSCLSWWCRW